MKLYAFREYMFKDPYAPYFDAYKEHTFRIVKEPYPNHVELECASDPELIVKGLVHTWDLIKC